MADSTPKQNWEARNYRTLGPGFLEDIKNPEVGSEGANAYVIYAVCDNKDSMAQWLSEGAGTYHIKNSKSIEITAGENNDNQGTDIVINAKKGDITLTCMQNGSVRISAQNIVMTADEDIDLVAGRNVNITGKNGHVFLKSKKVSAFGLDGNLVEGTLGTFKQRVFFGSFVDPSGPGMVPGMGGGASALGIAAGVLGGGGTSGSLFSGGDLSLKGIAKSAGKAYVTSTLGPVGGMAFDEVTKDV